MGFAFCTLSYAKFLSYEEFIGIFVVLQNLSGRMVERR
jgi:hypothetical protein